MTSACSSRKVCVFAPSVSRRRSGRQMIPEQRLAARAVDRMSPGSSIAIASSAVSGGGGPLHRMRVARVDQIAERALDRRSAGRSPWVQPRSSVIRSDGMERWNARLRQLSRIEDGLDVVAVEVVGAVVLDRVRGEVRREADHPGARVLVALLVEADVESRFIDWSSAVIRSPTGPAPRTCTRPPECRVSRVPRPDCGCIRLLTSGPAADRDGTGLLVAKAGDRRLPTNVLQLEHH